jgi:hypothetical protein
MKKIVYVVLFWMMAITSVVAVPIQQSDIPSALEEWVPWVLYNKEDKLCPFSYQKFDNKRCRWPIKTSLELRNNGGSFNQQWSVFTAQCVAIVGRGDQWPENVLVDGQIKPVTRKDNKPQVYLTTGEHLVSGEFNWSALPKTVSLPADNGLVFLVVNGQQQLLPKVDKNGVLWLNDNSASPKKVENDSVTVVVQRHLKDSIPFEVTTRIELNVSGSEREIQLSGALLPGLIAKQLSSTLPARIEKDGVLRVQAKAGQWIISFTSSAPAMVEKLILPNNITPWPETEVWAFEAQPQLRQVTLSGVVAIAPKNSRLPPQWQQLPSFRLTSK